MVNVCDNPLHIFALGVAVIIAIKGEFPVLVLVNDAILSVPFNGKPIHFQCYSS